MIRIRISPRRIEVRGHASLGWCTAVSTVLEMVRHRATKWCYSTSERRNHYVIQRRRDALDEAAVGVLTDLSIRAALARRPAIILATHPDPIKRRRSRRRSR